MFLLSTLAFAQDALSIPYEMHTLDNGLTVILAEDHSVPVVQVNVWYHVGSKDEVEGRTGFAHLFEHLMFQGSENNDQDYFTLLQEVGGSVNGTTNMDRTNYFEGVPSQYLPLALWAEADQWCLEVADNGPGLPQSLLDQLPLQTSKASGSGLGLFVVQTTMENHHGQLDVAVSAEGGALLRLRFPALPSSGD